MSDQIFEIIGRIITNIRSLLCLVLRNEPPRSRPWRWNYSPVQECNNCYNYACNIITETPAKPGYASGNTCDNTVIETVESSALSDGLKECTEQIECTRCTICGHKVALFRTFASIKGYGYHWARQDRGGTWSDKMGEGPVSGFGCTDPTILKENTALKFIKFFCVKKNDVRISGPSGQGGSCNR